MSGANDHFPNHAWKVSLWPKSDLNRGRKDVHLWGQCGHDADGLSRRLVTPKPTWRKSLADHVVSRRENRKAALIDHSGKPARRNASVHLAISSGRRRVNMCSKLARRMVGTKARKSVSSRFDSTIFPTSAWQATRNIIEA
jgi:hypothetical protein